MEFNFTQLEQDICEYKKSEREMKNEKYLKQKKPELVDNNSDNDKGKHFYKIFLKF